MVAFLLNEEMDSSLRFNLQRELANAPDNIENIEKLLDDPQLSRLILEGL